MSDIERSEDQPIQVRPDFSDKVMKAIEGITPSSEPDWVDSLTEEERIERLKLEGFEPFNAPPQLKEKIMELYRRGNANFSPAELEIIV